MSIKRVYHRAVFNSELDAQDRIDFIDQQFGDFASSGIDGVIVGIGGCSEFILEGDPQAVDEKIDELVNAAELEANESIFQEERSSGYGELVSHTDNDPRDQN